MKLGNDEQKTMLSECTHSQDIKIKTQTLFYRIHTLMDVFVSLLFTASNDPWATGGGAAPAAAAGFAAPWDTPAGVPANGSHKPLGMTMDDDFELLTKRSTPVAPSTMPVSASMGKKLKRVLMVCSDHDLNNIGYVHWGNLRDIGSSPRWLQ